MCADIEKYRKLFFLILSGKTAYENSRNSYKVVLIGSLGVTNKNLSQRFDFFSKKIYIVYKKIIH